MGLQQSHGYCCGVGGGGGNRMGYLVTTEIKVN